MIDVLVMCPVLATPHQRRVFKSSRTENESEKFHRPMCLKCKMRKEAVIAERDRESARTEHHEEQHDLKPIDSELPDVGWNRGQGEDERSDKEGTGDPIDSVEWYA